MDDLPPLPAPPKPRSLRNLKKLSLTIPTSCTNSGPATASVLPQPNLPIFQQPPPLPAPAHIAPHPIRRASIVSLPPVSTAALYRKDEAESPSAPYKDGPIEVMPNLWIGDEDNARDWKSLRERGIKSILNVAKELPCPLQHHQHPLRGAQSTSNLTTNSPFASEPTYYPAHLPTGRPAFHYLKLPWSHGQADLVKGGFPIAMQFVDESLAHGDGVLIHCQCGVSRSATLVIALVMRAAALSGSSTPLEIAALKGGGMHAAYAFVKEKSKWVGPNMSLIYQLLDYERALQLGNASPSSSTMSGHANDEDLEWERQRQALDDHIDPPNPVQVHSVFAYEAKALDKEMEERKIARKSSQASVTSSSSGFAGASGWRSRYGYPSLGRRSRAGSISSNLTVQSSAFSDNILEEGEEDLPFSTHASPSTLATDEDVHGWPKELGDNEHAIVIGALGSKVLTTHQEQAEASPTPSDGSITTGPFFPHPIGNPYPRI